jgi:hypothetical protein
LHHVGSLYIYIYEPDMSDVIFMTRWTEWKNKNQAETETGNTSAEYCIAIIYTTQMHSTDQNTELDKLCANVI